MISTRILVDDMRRVAAFLDDRATHGSEVVAHLADILGGRVRTGRLATRADVARNASQLAEAFERERAELDAAAATDAGSPLARQAAACVECVRFLRELERVASEAASAPPGRSP